MELSLVEQFLLLALNPKKGRFILDSLSLNYGIAGGVFLELSEKGKVTVKNKKLEIIDRSRTNNIAFNNCLDIISKSKKKRKIKFWVNKIGNKANPMKKFYLDQLIQKKVLVKKTKYYLWGLIKVNRYPIMNTKVVDDIRFHLKNVVFDKEKPKVNDILLLSLTHSSKLSRVLFIDKKEYREANKRIKELTKNIEISGAVSEAIKEVQAAVAVATSTAFIGATTAATS